MTRSAILGTVHFGTVCWYEAFSVEDILTCHYRKNAGVNDTFNDGCCDLVGHVTRQEPLLMLLATSGIFLQEMISAE